MKRQTGPWLVAWIATLAFGVISPGARGQEVSEQLSKLINDPERLEELKKERLRAPVEFFRSQVMPHDILPYVKANHWSMIGLEMRVNHEDYDGSLQSRPVMLADQPHEMIYRRDARLVKGQRSRLTMPILLPQIPKELGFQLIRPEAIRQDEEWKALLRILEPHQQMVVVLSKAANDQFARWSQFRATLPSAAVKEDSTLVERQRYYRMVLPLEPEKPLLSPHPLTWSPISHVIWDGLSPEALGTGQQQAMVDWLHWGGQLIIVGGAGPVFAPLRESFLGSYLPAEPSGENVSRTGPELSEFARAYPPPVPGRDPEEPIPLNMPFAEAWNQLGHRYKDPAPIPVVEKKPMFMVGLTPKPGATVIPLGGPGNPPLGVEWKVGRGRVLMLALSLTDPDLIGWPGYDTMIRRVVLRRPEELLIHPMGLDGNGLISQARYEPLNGNDLTTVRYLSRDLGAPTRVATDEDGVPVNTSYRGASSINMYANEVPVGEWLDSADLPRLSRDVLERASGIEIPGRDFVLKVILAYILILVPVNYAICRYLLKRREWAWVAIPLLSLGFAIGVERAAAYDVGYDSSCDEVDLIETHGDYPRGHISRFASLYSTGRVNFSISYPNDPTALALPLATGRALRGEDTTQSSFQTQPIPALTGFLVQPRSLSMFRAEQMTNLPGTITLSAADQGPRMVVNESGLDLNDAWVIEVGADKTLVGAALGSVASGAKVPLGQLAEVAPNFPVASGQLDPAVFMELLLKKSAALRPEDVGELRLIGWSKDPLPGQMIEPPVDRRRGFTFVVAHLRPSPLLDPASERYNALAYGPERLPVVPPSILSTPPPQTNPGAGVGRRGARPPAAVAIPGGAAISPIVPSAPTGPATTAKAAANPKASSPPASTSNAPENPRP